MLIAHQHIVLFIIIFGTLSISHSVVVGFDVAILPRLYGAGARYVYSNFGYLVLGLVVDRFSDGLGYERYVQDLLRRIGIFRMKLGITQPQHFDVSQVLLDFVIAMPYLLARVR